jgi:hypothetical protein
VLPEREVSIIVSYCAWCVFVLLTSLKAKSDRGVRRITETIGSHFIVFPQNTGLHSRFRDVGISCHNDRASSFCVVLSSIGRGLAMVLPRPSSAHGAILITRPLMQGAFNDTVVLIDLMTCRAEQFSKIQLLHVPRAGKEAHYVRTPYSSSFSLM